MGGCVAHEGAQMIGAEVDLIGEGELGGGDAEICRSAVAFEDLVAARIFKLEGELAAA